jgi:hypothetical protein
MNPTENCLSRGTDSLEDDTAIAFGRLLRGGLLLGGIVALVLAAGCRKPPSPRSDKGDSAVTRSDPWDGAARRLRRETDLITCRTALGILNNELGSQNNTSRPASLSAEAEAAIARLVPLDPADREEIHGGVFSSHDPVYLAECLYLRDAAQNLQVPGLKPEQAADLGFAWVCRQVYLNPWLLPTRTGAIAAAVPPSYVLRRGSGSALERMYVFLALLQQMGLDGCLIGPPGAAEVAAYSAVTKDKKPIPGGPALPFWAVGVRTGNEIRLYDPWRGEAFPATLNEMRSRPESCKAWLEDKGNSSGVTQQDIAAAAVYVAAPVNSLSSRMAMLEEKVKGDLKVRLAVDAAALQAAFPGPKPTFWNPVNDRFAYGRVSRTFLPLELGGSDAGDSQSLAYNKYQSSLLPVTGLANLPAVFGTLVELPPDDRSLVSERLVGNLYATYIQAFFEPPNPREVIQRGDFQRAARDLVEKQDRFRSGRERLRNTRDAAEQIAAWGKNLKQLYEELGRAGLRGDPEEKALARNAAQAAIDNHWRDPAVVLLVDRLSAEVEEAEATYLLALCKHEQAERAQARAEHPPGGEDAARLQQEALDAWAVAISAWGTYESLAEIQRGFPGRAVHTRALIERAEKMASRKGASR